MRIFGYDINRAAGAKDGNPRADSLSRSRAPLGPLSGAFAAWQPSRVSAPLYESLRENIGVIDRALALLVCFDGIVGFEGKNQGLVDEITEWAKHIRVNDTTFGLQTFINNFSNEAYEQGHMVSQYVASPGLDDIVKLVVADSKDIIYIRGPKGLEIWYRPILAYNQVRSAMQSPAGRIQDILQGRYNYVALPSIMGGVGYAKIEGDNVMLYSVRNENQNPYGTSYLRSIPFVAQILLTIHNSVRLNWERYGDPAYKIIYKGSKGDIGDKTLPQRQKEISDTFTKAMDAKKNGTAADFVMALGKDSDLSMEIIGAEGKVMTMELPSRAMLEQIVAAMSVPPNLLGLQWSSTERNAQFQVEVALQEGFTRAMLKTALVERLVRDLLRLRGIKWKPGDWKVVFNQPNLHDQVAQAQANFLNAQAEQMRSGAVTAPSGSE